MAQHVALPAGGGAGASTRCQQRAIPLLPGGRADVPEVNGTDAATGSYVKGKLYICLYLEQ